MSDQFVMLHWDRGDARLKAFSLSSRGAATTVKVEIEVTSPWALASLLDQLNEAKRKPAPVRSTPARPTMLPKAQAAIGAPLLALPAPESDHG